MDVPDMTGKYFLAKISSLGLKMEIAPSKNTSKFLIL